jgi:hypothetical protein
MMLNRCPVAIRRDQDPDTRLWVRWAQRWAYAKSTGSLSTYLRRPSLRTLDLIEIAEEELATIKAENWEREQKRLKAGGS